MKKKITIRIIAMAIGMFSMMLPGQAQVFKWNRTFPGTAGVTDKGYAVAADQSGSVYMTGYVVNTTSSTDIITRKYNSAGTLVWSMTYSGTNAGVMERGNCIAVDARYVYVAGTAYNGANNSDFVLLRYDITTGALSANYPKFYADASGTELPEAKSVVIVGGGSDVYVSGSTYSTVTGWKVLVHKDNVSGIGWNASWTPYTYQGSATTTQHEANDLRADATDVYVTGVIGVTSQGTNCMTAKLLASNGSQTWVRTYNGAGSMDDCSNALNVESGNVWIAGYSTSGITGKDALLIKYNSSGTQQFVTLTSYSNDDVWNDIVTFTSAGSVIAGVTGYKTINASPAALDKDYMTATYTSVGALWGSWATNPVYYNGTKAVPESSITDEAWGIEFLSDRLYVSGRSFETITEVDITTIGYTAASGAQAWVHKYDYGINNHDEMFNKYALFVQYNRTYCIDEIFITGHSKTTSTQIDCNTLKYSCNICVACRMANPDLAGSAQSSGFFPNPFSTSATLRVDANTVVTNATLEIYDISGKIVGVRTELNSNEILISRGDLENGIYFYQLTNESGIITSGKFVIAD